MRSTSSWRCAGSNEPKVILSNLWSWPFRWIWSQQQQKATKQQAEKKKPKFCVVPANNLQTWDTNCQCVCVCVWCVCFVYPSACMHTHHVHTRTLVWKHAEIRTANTASHFHTSLEFIFSAQTSVSPTPQFWWETSTNEIKTSNLSPIHTHTHAHTHHRHTHSHTPQTHTSGFSCLHPTTNTLIADHYAAVGIRRSERPAACLCYTWAERYESAEIHSSLNTETFTLPSAWWCTISWS